jgi:replicative DNA helicase
MRHNLIRGDELFSSWKRDLLSGEPPIHWALADESSPLNEIQAGPGRVTVIGGAPGGGKTAFVMQLMTDGLRLSDELRVLVANVEMAPGVLMDRQLSRLSGIDLNIIQDRKFLNDHTARLNAGFAELEFICGRLGFVRGPFTFDNVAAAADELEPQILVLDYLQRFQSSASSDDRRGGLDQSMSLIRRFADAGSCVFVVSALSRQKNSQGRSGYDAETLTLAAFRDSSEIEFGVDDAYIMTTGKEPSERVLKHLKSRNGECRDIALEFNGSVQRFSGTFIDDVAGEVGSWWPK